MNRELENGLIDLGAASLETKGSYVINQDTDNGKLGPAGLTAE